MTPHPSLRRVASRLLAAAEVSRDPVDACAALLCTLDVVQIGVRFTGAFGWTADMVSDVELDLCAWHSWDAQLIASGHGDRTGDPVYVFLLGADDANVITSMFLDAIEVWSSDVAEDVERLLANRRAA